MGASKRFDLVVIGTGSAGTAVAKRCRKSGWSVAIADSRPFGGTCANRGCDPKKVLVGVAEAVDAARRLEGKGVRGAPAVDWRDLASFKRTFTDPVPEESEEGLKALGVETLHGPARFTGATTVQVGEAVLEARHVVIATGAVPMKLGLPGEAHLVTSDGFLDLPALPPRIVFLGSGYISFEFAHIAATAGAKVTMLELLDRPLAGFDPDLVGLLVERTRRMGIDLHLKTRAEAIEKTDRAYLVRTTSPDGTATFEADLVVHGAGRVPNLDDLDLGRGGVERGKHGVVVDAHLRSVSNPAVYAAGDAAASGPMLTPVAGFAGRLVAENLLHGDGKAIAYPPVPSVVYTLPHLATVGLSEAEARAQGRKFHTNFQRTSGWYSSRRLGEAFTAHKVLVEEPSGRILGAHLLGPGADELINLFALAMRTGLSADELRDSIFAYPTLASNLPYML